MFKKPGYELIKALPLPLTKLPSLIGFLIAIFQGQTTVFKFLRVGKVDKRKFDVRIVSRCKDSLAYP